MYKNNMAPLVTTPNKYLDKHYIKNQARGRWPQILNYFGIDATYLKNKHGSCPGCGGKDRFRFDNNNGNGTFICNRCGAGDGFKLLTLYLDCNFQQALHKVSILVDARSDVNYTENPRHIKDIACGKTERSDTNTGVTILRERLNRIWKQSRSIVINDPVNLYLKSRGIALTQHPISLRFHPSLKYYDDERKLIGNFPAMVAMVLNEHNRPVSLHRTYLGNGCKAAVDNPKKIMSPIHEGGTRGGAIKLFHPYNGELVVAEGIETALALHVATQLPVWATLSAGGMANVVISADVRHVIIAADNDRNNAGQNAANKLAKRLLSEGRSVKCVIPPQVDTDFADVLMEEK